MSKPPSPRKRARIKAVQVETVRRSREALTRFKDLARRLRPFLQDPLTLIWSPDPDVRNAAAFALAAREDFLTTVFADPRGHQAYRREIGRVGKAAARRWLREEVFPQAILLATSEVDEKTRIRLGRTTPVRDLLRPDLVLPMRPRELSGGELDAWLRQRAKAQAVAIMTDIDPSPRRPRLPDQPRQIPGNLSPRQREVAILLTAGLSYSEIAARLGIKGTSAKKYGQRLRRRLPKE